MKTPKNAARGMLPVPQVHHAELSPGLLKTLGEFLEATRDSSIEESIRNLVAVRVAQRNGCACCQELHARQAKLRGECELRLYHLASWRDAMLFTPRERAALAWTEVLTELPDQGVADEIYDYVRTELSQKEIWDLSFVVMVAGSLNRLGVGFKLAPDSAGMAVGREEVGLN